MTRLFWNFEIIQSPPFDWENLKSFSPDDAKWEMRFFWSGNEVIKLHGMGEEFLELSRYEAKHREDIYYLLPKQEMNLKERRGQLLYKPIFKKNTLATAFGKKIKIEALSPQTRLPGVAFSVQELQQKIIDQSQRICVSKEALLFRLPNQPEIKLEFARLKVKDKLFFSLSIETYEFSWLENIKKMVINDKNSCDYVTFLKTITEKNE